MILNLKTKGDNTKKIIVCFLITAAYLAVTVFAGKLGYLENIEKRVRGADSVYYFIYLPSLIFDKDFDFENNLRHIYGQEYTPAYTSKGLAENVFSIGPAIMWLPGYISAHAVTLIKQNDSNLNADGYSRYYTLFVYILNSLYGLLGVIFTAFFLFSFFKPKNVLLACLGILLASQMTYYLWSFTTMSHNTSFATAALFFFIWQKKGLHFLTGLAAAIMILCRWQNALLLLPIGFCFTVDIIARRRKDKILSVSFIIPVFWFSIALIAGFIPQMLVWKELYGSFITIPQGKNFINFSDLPVFEVLFGSSCGLFLWHPLLFIGLIGICFFWKKNKVLTISFLGIFLFQLFLNAAVHDWHAGWSFGHRRFISLLPLFAFGVAYLIEITGRKGLIIASILILFLTVWNQLFIFQYQKRLIPLDKPLSFEEVITDKFKLNKIIIARQSIINACKAYMKGDRQSYIENAKRGYQLMPEHYKARIVYALSCLLSNNQNEGKKVLGKWIEQDPDNLVPRWAMAELLVRSNEFENALLMFDDKILNKYPKLVMALRNRIKNGKKTIIGKVFIRMYKNCMPKSSDFYK